MSGTTCGVCGTAACCPHHLHAGADLNSRAFSIFPTVVHDQAGMQPPGNLHEFEFFGNEDNESVAWLFNHDQLLAVGGNDRSPVENHRHHKPLTFDPFRPQYQPGNGLTFEVSLGQGEVDAGLGLGSGARHMVTAASATIVSTGSKNLRITWPLAGPEFSLPSLHVHSSCFFASVLYYNSFFQSLFLLLNQSDVSSLKYIVCV